jgi:hypothetical protein
MSHYMTLLLDTVESDVGCPPCEATLSAYVRCDRWLISADTEAFSRAPCIGTRVRCAWNHCRLVMSPHRPPILLLRLRRRSMAERSPPPPEEQRAGSFLSAPNGEEETLGFYKFCVDSGN